MEGGGGGVSTFGGIGFGDLGLSGDAENVDLVGCGGGVLGLEWG